MTIFDDEDDEGEEVIQFMIEHVANGFVGENENTTILILDNDPVESDNETGEELKSGNGSGAEFEILFE